MFNVKDKKASMIKTLWQESVDTQVKYSIHVVNAHWY